MLLSNNDLIKKKRSAIVTLFLFTNWAHIIDNCVQLVLPFFQIRDFSFLKGF